MIYEIAIMVRSEVNEEALKTIKNIVTENVDVLKGTVLVSEDWGILKLAEATKRGGISRAKFLYFMYKTDGSSNKEIIRKLGIDESVIRHLIVVLGIDADEAAILKAYQNPLTQQVDAMMDEEMEKDRRMSSKRRSCWFSANKTTPDWKSPRTYSWLVNEFGKISPARVTGLRPNFQRKANDAIKRGRFMGLLSNMSNHTAYKA